MTYPVQWVGGPFDGQVVQVWGLPGCITVSVDGTECRFTPRHLRRGWVIDWYAHIPARRLAVGPGDADKRVAAFRQELDRWPHAVPQWMPPRKADR